MNNIPYATAFTAICATTLLLSSCNAEEKKTETEPSKGRDIELTGKVIEKEDYVKQISGKKFSLNIQFVGNVWDDELKRETTNNVQNLLAKRLNIDPEGELQISIYLELSAFGDMCLYQMHFGVIDELITVSGDNFRVLVYNKNTAGVQPVAKAYDTMNQRISAVIEMLFNDMKEDKE